MNGTTVTARSAASDKASAVKKYDSYLDANSSMLGSNKGAEVEFVDADAMRAAIQQVRDDSDPTMWALAGYRDKKSIELIGTGTGDVSELLSNCRDQSVCYGIFRIVEQIDKTKATKFCFIQWQACFFFTFLLPFCLSTCKAN